MTATTTDSALLQRADQRGGVALGGFLVRELVPGASTDGRVTVVDHVIPPRTLASPWHVHAETVEISVVVSGTVGVLIGDEEMTASVGDVVHKPAGIWHAFWNPVDEPARIVELLTPSGFEHFFWGAESAFGPDGVDFGRLGEVAEANDIEIDPSSLERLTTRYGLRGLGGA